MKTALLILTLTLLSGCTAVPVYDEAGNQIGTTTFLQELFHSAPEIGTDAATKITQGDIIGGLLALALGTGGVYATYRYKTRKRA